MKHLKNNKGITLVALVVTIIILIILATISIRMVIGEGGLIWQANNAKVEYRAAEVEEEVLAWKAEKQMAKYTDGITPQGREALIADQLKRGLLTQEEADMATETGQVKIGSRTIHYGEDETSGETSQTLIRIEPTYLEMNTTTKNEETLTVTISSEKTTEQGLTWTSEPEGIVQIEPSEDGAKVRALKAGQTTVTVTTNSNAKAECTVKVLSELVQAAKDGTVFEKNTPLKDEHENIVVVPGKFHVANDTGETVQQGACIEDSDGNQFVWIPVSNIDRINDSENSKPIIKDDGSSVTITLGRYTFASSRAANPGEPTLVQKGSEYKESNEDGKFTIEECYSELNIPRESSGSGYSSVNTTAKNLKAFIESIQNYHGFYFGRYEASYGSGSVFGVGGNTDYYKPLVQKSTNNTGISFAASAWRAERGFLWNFITQGNASMVCRNMYNENDVESSYVESDLVNSYAWDTAIVFIQAMGNSNYANQGISNDELENTGYSGDEKCHIFDMAGNLLEWTTEYSIKRDGTSTKACVYRGVSWYSNSHAAYRYCDYRSKDENDYGFRPLLYIKGNAEG